MLQSRHPNKRRDSISLTEHTGIDMPIFSCAFLTSIPVLFPEAQGNITWALLHFILTHTPVLRSHTMRLTQRHSTSFSEYRDLNPVAIVQKLQQT